MNAPESIQNINIPLAKLLASKTNPRKRFDDKKLSELAESIKSQGILQPILVRGIEFPLAINYEIIAGERRYRAAKLAGLSEMPCIVRKLTDTQVLHAQVIENLQRDDLHKLEEAEGYERLLKEKDANGEPYTAESIGREVGKSKAYIYANLKLLALCEEARDAFYKGDLDASRALLIARMPVHTLQLKVLAKAVERNAWNGEHHLSYRGLRDMIQNEYMLDLDRAPFNIKDVNLTPKAGSCKDCEKRTGNQPELFDDVGSKDVCTDPVCHALKKTAHVLALQKAAEDKGNKLLMGKDAKKLIPNYMQSPEEHLRDHGYATLDSKVPGDDQKRTYEQMLKEAKLLTPAKDTGKPTVGKTIVENPNKAGQLIETVSIEQAVKALREAGYELVQKAAPATKDNGSEHDKRRAKEEADLAIENAFRSRLFDTLHAQIEADMTDASSKTFPILYRMLAAQLWNDVSYADDEDLIALMRKYTTLPNDHADVDWPTHIAEFGENLPNLTPAQHLMLIIELPLLLEEISTGHTSHKATTMLTLAKELDIDADGMKKEVADEVKAEQKAKTAAAKKVSKAEQTAAPATKPEQPKARPKASWPFPTPDQASSNQSTT